MRYWIMLENDCHGPVEAEKVALLPGINLDVRVCPEGLNPLHPKSWRPAFQFPDIPLDLATGKTEDWTKETAYQGNRLLSWKTWAFIILCAVGFCARQFPAQPDSLPERLADAPAETPRQPSIYDTIVKRVVPACEPDLGPASRLDLEATLADGGYLLRWTSRHPTLGGEILFQYDSESRILKPLNPAAQRLLMRRSSC